MSSKTVRDDMETAWQNLLPDVPFFNTSNRTPNHVSLPPLWATMLYEAERQRITIGGEPACWREIGTVGVVIMSMAGEGDEASGILAARIMATFNSYVGVQGRMMITNVQPPKDIVNDIPPKSHFYKTLVEIDYTYETYE